jgi:hypothetical protein
VKSNEGLGGLFSSLIGKLCSGPPLHTPTNGSLTSKRLVVIGSPNLRVAAPEPSPDDLLPCADVEWSQGEISFNEALLSHGFSSAADLGPFARSCQAAHMLGKVLIHSALHRTGAQAPPLYEEAIMLHQALVKLGSSLGMSEPDAGADRVPSMVASIPMNLSLTPAVAICVAARFLLYSLYACNEPGKLVGRERVPLEAEVQKLSLAGIQSLASMQVPVMAENISACRSGDLQTCSPLVASCLYHAAGECAWFIKEDNREDMRTALDHIVRALKTISRRWLVGGKFSSPS